MLETNPDIRPHLMLERGRPRKALVWLVHCSLLHQSRDRQRPWPEENGLAGRSSLPGPFLGAEQDAPNPTHGDADGWPPESERSWLWGEPPMETSAVREGFGLPDPRSTCLGGGAMSRESGHAGCHPWRPGDRPKGRTRE